MGLTFGYPRHLLKAASILSQVFKTSFGLSKGCAPNETRRTHRTFNNKYQALVEMHGFSAGRSFSHVVFSSESSKALRDRIGTNNKSSRAITTTSLFTQPYSNGSIFFGHITARSQTNHFIGNPPIKLLEFLLTTANAAIHGNLFSSTLPFPRRVFWGRRF